MDDQSSAAASETRGGSFVGGEPIQALADSSTPGDGDPSKSGSASSGSGTAQATAASDPDEAEATTIGGGRCSGDADELSDPDGVRMRRGENDELEVDSPGGAEVSDDDWPSEGSGGRLAGSGRRTRSADDVGMVVDDGRRRFADVLERLIGPSPAAGRPAVGRTESDPDVSGQSRRADGQLEVTRSADPPTDGRHVTEPAHVTRADGGSVRYCSGDRRSVSTSSDTGDPVCQSADVQSHPDDDDSDPEANLVLPSVVDAEHSRKAAFTAEGSSTSFSGSDAPVQRPTPPIDPDKPQVTRSQDDIHIKSQPISSDVASANGSACNTVSTGPESNQDVERLRSEVKQLRRELSKCHETIQKLQDREAVLKDRLSEQALRCIEVSSKFEDLSLGNDRPTQLIRRYGNLYTETRLDAFDALEDLPEIADFDDLKGKLLFSVVVLAFRSVQRTLADTRARVRQLLCMPAPDSKVREPVARQVEDMIGLYLRKSVSRYDTSKNVEEVCDQVWSTLYDYPSLRQCEGLRRYITECVQLAWALSVQNPPLVIDYNCDVFNEDVHTRFHTSNPESTRVLTVLWPILREGEGGPCVYKGVVIT